MERNKFLKVLNKTCPIKNILVAFLFLIGLVFNMGDVKAYDSTPVFEGVGRYGFATASAPLARKLGDLNSTGLNPTTTKINLSIRPEENSHLDLDAFKTGISKIGVSYDSVSNLSGSMLKVDSDVKIKAAYLSTMYLGHPNNYDVLVVYPDGQLYKKYTADGDKPVNLTADMQNIDNPGGYYFVSILNCGALMYPQQAWSITVIYEDESLPTSYTKLIQSTDGLDNNPNNSDYQREVTVYLNSPFKLLDNFLLMGVVKGAGVYGFANVPGASDYDDRHDSTHDRAWACVKKNGVSYGTDCPEAARINLASMSGHFNGRTEVDFVNNTYDTSSMTVADKTDLKLGGEIDVFNEKLTKEDLGNQELLGVTFSKDGVNAYNLQFIGVAAEIEAPDIKVTPDIEENNGITSNTVTFENTSEYEGCNPSLVIPIDEKLENVRDVVLSATNGVSYEIQPGKIVVSFDRNFAAGEKITVTYKADRKKTNNKIESGTIHLNPVGTVYPSSAGACTTDDKYKITATGSDESSAYTLIVNHFKDGTTEPIIPNSTTTTVKMAGSHYNTSSLSELPDGYVLVGTPANHEGTMNSDVVVNYYYKLRNVSITVRHLEEGTETVLDTVPPVTKTYGDNYTTSKSNKAEVTKNYELVAVPDNASGVAKGDITVTYYYRLKDAVITVHHREEGTNKELAPDETINKKFGENYTTTPSDKVKQNYIYKTRTNNYAGVVEQDTIDVIYYYQKKDSNIVPSIVKEGTDKITSSNQKVNYSITYNANFTDYIGEAVVTITDTLPYKIDPNNSNLNGGVYDDNAKTITWTETINVDSYTSSSYSVTKNIEVLYKDIDLTKRVMTNEVAGKITGDGKDITVEQNHNTEVEIIGDITIRYIDKDTGKDIADQIKTSDYVGQTYDSSEKEVYGYRLVEKPSSEHFTYREGAQTAEYKYERIKLKIETKVNGDGGTITGDEDVFYGEDSTKDNIKITSHEGYLIDKLTINGSEIKVPENSEMLIVSNFPHMTENKLVEVSFKKKPLVVKVPKTSSFIIIPIILGLIILGASVYVIKNKTINFDFFKKN